MLSIGWRSCSFIFFSLAVEQHIRQQSRRVWRNFPIVQYTHVERTNERTNKRTNERTEEKEERTNKSTRRRPSPSNDRLPFRSLTGKTVSNRSLIFIVFFHVDEENENAINTDGRFSDERSFLINRRLSNQRKRRRRTKTHASDFLSAVGVVLDLDVSAICAVDDEDGEDDWSSGWSLLQPMTNVRRQKSSANLRRSMSKRNCLTFDTSLIACWPEIDSHSSVGKRCMPGNAVGKEGKSYPECHGVLSPVHLVKFTDSKVWRMRDSLPLSLLLYSGRVFFVSICIFALICLFRKCSWKTSNGEKGGACICYWRESEWVYILSFIHSFLIFNDEKKEQFLFSGTLQSLIGKHLCRLIKTKTRVCRSDQKGK